LESPLRGVAGRSGDRGAGGEADLVVTRAAVSKTLVLAGDLPRLRHDEEPRLGRGCANATRTVKEPRRNNCRLSPKFVVNQPPLPE
jgi:hypothetical protein